ncbi:hypothetical protein N8T08_008361 [Aspergillus melleus]|uniref:Uncharacterized protein n=1 Tax=Aspergillus melleus TaxID=138277 RepID=A0ACC3AVP8_9EURO|nr:hypothetical protein N8T08_008361 [Aspergillus melleus]
MEPHVQGMTLVIALKGLLAYWKEELASNIDPASGLGTEVLWGHSDWENHPGYFSGFERQGSQCEFWVLLPSGPSKISLENLPRFYSVGASTSMHGFRSKLVGFLLNQKQHSHEHECPLVCAIAAQERKRNR